MRPTVVEDPGVPVDPRLGVAIFTLVSLFFLVLVVVRIRDAIRHWRWDRTLTRELPRAARALGWSYTNRDRTYDKRYRRTGAPFDRGVSRRARHIMRGVHRGRYVIVFQYQHTDNWDDNHTTYYYLVAVLGLPTPQPRLQVGPRKERKTLLGFLRKQDTQLESDEFNQRFYIQTDNERFAHTILHPRMMQWMLTDDMAGERSFRFLGAGLTGWQSGSAHLPDMIQLVDYVCDIADTVPAFVWTNY